MDDDTTFTLRAMVPTDGPALAALGEETPETGVVIAGPVPMREDRLIYPGI